MRRIPAFFLLVAVSVSLAPASSSEDAVARGVAFLARSWQGDGYDDEYLRYVYPGERLDCPLPDCRLTYRLIDAYVNLSLLDRAGVPHGPAREQFARAREVLAAIVPLWRERGLYNVRRAPDEEGIALDTYCIVGLLDEDRIMAEVAAAHLDGDDWLPDNHYADEESFRKLADETWCVRLLESASRGGRREVPRLTRLALRRGRALLEEDRPAEFRANVALHLLYLVDDGGGRSLRADRESLRFLLLEFAADPALERDTLTQANILQALASTGDVSRSALKEIAERLLRHQDEDGGWHSRVGETGTGLRVFTTMRALLALAEYGKIDGPRAARKRPELETRR